MNIKKHLFLILALLMTFLMSNHASAVVWTQNVAPIPIGALTNDGKKVNICHRTSSATNPFVFINISIHGLNGHDGHSTDEFLINGLCGGTGQPPSPECKNKQIHDANGNCINVPNCKKNEVLNEAGNACITPPICTGQQTLNVQGNECDLPICSGGQILNAAQNACICPTGKTLVNGVCTITCPTGQSLVNDVCTTICPEGKSLVNGVCTTTCPNEQVFVNNACTCPTGKTLVNGVCQNDLPSQSQEPTVNSLKTSVTKPTITGTAGTSTTLTIALAKKSSTDESYTTIIEATTVTITENGAWSFTPTIALKPGFYDVIATGNQGVDTTDDELEIAIDICDREATPNDQLISLDEWEGNKESSNYYLGKCAASSDAESLPLSPVASGEKLPDYIQPLKDQYRTVVTLEYCEDGGVKSDNEATSATIKRATIINASTEGGAVDLFAMPTKIKYGVKAPAIGIMDISSATITGGNKATNVTLTGVTIDDVFIDTNVDYIDVSGNPINGGTYIPVAGGVTKPLTIREDGSTTEGILTRGIITAGNDAAGNPVRGSMTSGVYNSDIVNANTVLTKGRRTRGKLVNATIENAQTTSLNGVTVIDAGNVKAGELQAGSTSPVSTFGTVINATLTNVSISNTNHCFSGGSIGSRGQLNWKEVVK